MQLKTYIVASFLLCCAFSINAQNELAEANTSESHSTELPSLEGDSWTFYLDTETKVYYIDFETISVNLSEIKVKNDADEVVLKDELWELPVNTIYELDFTGLEPGTYHVELSSYTGVIKKEVTIAD